MRILEGSPHFLLDRQVLLVLLGSFQLKKNIKVRFLQIQAFYKSITCLVEKIKLLILKLGKKELFYFVMSFIIYISDSHFIFAFILIF